MHQGTLTRKNQYKSFFGLLHPRFLINVCKVNVAIVKRRNLLKLIPNIEEYRKNPHCNKQTVELVLEVSLRSGRHQSKSRSPQGSSFYSSKDSSN